MKRNLLTNDKTPDELLGSPLEEKVQGIIIDPGTYLIKIRLPEATKDSFFGLSEKGWCTPVTEPMKWKVINDGGGSLLRPIDGTYRDYYLFATTDFNEQMGVTKFKVRSWFWQLDDDGHLISQRTGQRVSKYDDVADNFLYLSRFDPSYLGYKFEFIPAN